MVGSNQTRPPHIEIVAFSAGDPSNPKNWSRNFKRLNVLMVSILTFVSMIGSSLYVPAESHIQQQYGVSADVSRLGLTSYVFGLAFGLLICPMGEMYGRRRPSLIAWTLFLMSLAPSAWINNVELMIFFRFIAGIAGSASFIHGSAISADLYKEADSHARAIAANYFSFSAFSGPVVGPIIGFFISSRLPNGLWTLRVHLFIALAVSPIVLVLPETHSPTILAVRAERMRQAGHPQAWAHRQLHHRSIAQLMETSSTRPLAMLVREPLVMGAAVWNSLTYGILYLFFEAYPVIFIRQHGIPVELAGLPFLPILIGMVIAAVTCVPLVEFFQAIKLPRWLEVADEPHSPESRMKPAAVACLCLPISSFWLAWTSGSETHWIAPALSGIIFGFASLVIFLTFITYLSEAFTFYTASAVAATNLARFATGCIFPTMAHSVLDPLGTKWGISVFGFASIPLIPVPFIFLRYGSRLRASSYYVREALAMRQRVQAEEDEKDDASVAIPNAGDPGDALPRTDSAGSVPRDAAAAQGSPAEPSEWELSTLEGERAASPAIHPLETEHTVPVPVPQ